MLPVKSRYGTSPVVFSLMSNDIFPPADALGDAEFLCSRSMNAEMIKAAYWQGYFPWPDNSIDFIPWAHPAERGIIPLTEFHLPHMVARMVRQKKFELRIDSAFEQVIRACSQRPNGEESWITVDMIANYCQLHREGWAHSFEAWNRESGELAGGLYGISIGKIFAGESMFFRESGASKFALAFLGAVLTACDVDILDTQMVTPTTELFGARYIPREEYAAILRELRGEPLSTAQLRAAAIEQ